MNTIYLPICSYISLIDNNLQNFYFVLKFVRKCNRKGNPTLKQMLPSTLDKTIYKSFTWPIRYTCNPLQHVIAWGIKHNIHEVQYFMKSLNLLNTLVWLSSVHMVSCHTCSLHLCNMALTEFTVGTCAQVLEILRDISRFCFCICVHQYIKFKRLATNLSHYT